MPCQTFVSAGLSILRPCYSWLAVALLAQPAVYAQHKDIADHSTAELVAQISQIISGIWSLDTTFDVQFGVNDPPKRWRFARQHEKWHRTEISIEAGQGAERKSGVCFDGNYVYTLVVRTYKDGSQQWRHVEVQDGDREPPTHIFPDAMMGSRLSNIGCSIADAWIQVLPTLVSNPDGASKLICNGLSSSLPETGDLFFDIEYTIDPVHDLLPSQILITQQGVDASVWFQEWNVTEWMKALDEGSGEERWFPASGSLRQPGDAPEIVLTVHSVVVNSDLPEDLFQPANVPDGTAVVNATSAGHGEISIVGKDNPVDAVVMEITTNTRKHLEAKRGTNVLWRIVVPCFVLVGLTAFIVAMRRRRSEQ